VLDQPLIMLRSALVVAVLAATGAVASADTYLGLGIGTAQSVSTDNQVMALQGDGRSGKLLGGLRFGRLAVEGAAGRFGMVVNPYGYTGAATQLSVALKYSLPLGDNFEAFGRGGLQHTSIGLDEAVHSADDASGNGWLLGGGFEYRLNALIAGGSIFVDYEHASTAMTNNDMVQFHTSSGVWMLGAMLAL
jgi:hypothetical protein